MGNTTDARTTRMRGFRITPCTAEDDFFLPKHISLLEGRGPAGELHDLQLSNRLINGFLVRRWITLHGIRYIVRGVDPAFDLDRESVEGNGFRARSEDKERAGAFVFRMNPEEHPIGHLLGVLRETVTPDVGHGGFRHRSLA